MMGIISILFVMIIIDQFINRKLIKKLNIEEPALDEKYVNKLHKFVERILYLSSYIVMILTVNEFPHLRIWVFLGLSAVFGFRTIMEWNFKRGSKIYLLSAITCGLFILGAITYGTIDYFGVI